MMMQLNRDFVLVSKSGHSIAFLKDTPAHVPPRVVPEAIAAGAASVEKDKALELATLAEIKAAEIERDERAPKIESTIKMLLARNQRGDFTAGGRPNLAVLMKETGLAVTADELDPLWNKIKAEIQ